MEEKGVRDVGDHSANESYHRLIERGKH